ncbi:MAG: hypothetical protein K5756_07245 [Clostridiales bacterium]|nr:hypothetical protein [Clostridiales bacterium]
MYDRKSDDIELASELYPFDSRYEQRSNSHRDRVQRSKNNVKDKNEDDREKSRKNQKK